MVDYIGRAFDFFRFKDWFYSKVPSFLSLPCLFYLLGSLEIHGNIIRHLVYSFGFIFFYMAFSYVVNDYSDIEQDKACGKNKIIASMRKSVALAIIIALLCFSALFAVFAFGVSIYTTITLVVTYLLGSFYSIRPFRYKERGFIGLLECSFAQRCMPALLYLPIISFRNSVFWLVIVLFFLIGLRYILIHQVIDYENDVKSEIHTFSGNHLNAAKLMVYCCFFVELVITVIIATFAVPLSIIAIFLTGYIIIFALSAYSVKVLLNTNCFLTFHWVPLEDLFNIYIPLSLILSVAYRNNSLLLGIAAIVYFLPAFYMKLNLIINMFKVKFTEYKAVNNSGGE